MDFTQAGAEDGDEEATVNTVLTSGLSAGALKALQDLGLAGDVVDGSIQVKLKKPSAATVEDGSMDNAKFKTREYWDERFESEESYDWLASYDRVKHYLLPYLKPEDKILVVGCGNSLFSESLYKDGFNNIVNIDYSSTVIESMRDKHSVAYPLMKWQTMDMLQLTYADDEFDVVIDKATMDAIMVDEGDVWHPKEDCVRDAHLMCSGISRVLTQHGTYLQISFAQPHFRTKYLMGERFLQRPINHYSSSRGFCDLYKWNLEYFSLEFEQGCLNSFLYVMQK
jgi:2-polyprenyl-3-methyl-5-hydroxy-6-metoxy-1,4-benzoquinol methylase